MTLVCILIVCNSKDNDPSIYIFYGLLSQCIFRLSAIQSLMNLFYIQTDCNIKDNESKLNLD